MSTRKETAVTKLRVIWESIRRNQECQTLRTLYEKHRKDPEKSWTYLDEIQKKFGCFNPEELTKKATEIHPYYLKMYFKKPAIQISVISRFGIGTSKDRYFEVTLTIDMSQSCDQICKDFAVFIKNGKNRQKKYGFDIPPEKPLKDKQKIKAYQLKDFETYDLVNKRREKNKEITFYQIAKERLLAKERLRYGENLQNTVIDPEAKKLENAYERVQWLVNGGFRFLM